MIKEDIVEVVAEKIGVTKKDAAVIVERILESIAKLLAEGQKIEIREFGTFKVVERKAKLGRIIATGETVHVPPRKAPKFIPGKILKAMVNSSENVSAPESSTVAVPPSTPPQGPSF